MSSASSAGSVHAARAIRTLLRECPGCGDRLFLLEWSWLRLGHVRRFAPLSPHRACEIARSRASCASRIDQMFARRDWAELVGQLEVLSAEQFAVETLRSIVLFECGVTQTLHGISCTLEAALGSASRVEAVALIEPSAIPLPMSASLQWIDLNGTG